MAGAPSSDRLSPPSKLGVFLESYRYVLWKFFILVWVYVFMLDAFLIPYLETRKLHPENFDVHIVKATLLAAFFSVMVRVVFLKPLTQTRAPLPPMPSSNVPFTPAKPPPVPILSQFAELSPDTIVLFDLMGRVLAINQAGKALLLPTGEINDYDYLALFCPQHSKALRLSFRKASYGQESCLLVSRLAANQTNTRYLQRFFPVRDQSGQIKNVYGIAQNAQEIESTA